MIYCQIIWMSFDDFEYWKIHSTVSRSIFRWYDRYTCHTRFFRFANAFTSVRSRFDNFFIDETFEWFGEGFQIVHNHYQWQFWDNLNMSKLALIGKSPVFSLEEDFTRNILSGGTTIWSYFVSMDTGIFLTCTLKTVPIEMFRRRCFIRRRNNLL